MVGDRVDGLRLAIAATLSVLRLLVDVLGVNNLQFGVLLDYSAVRRAVR